MMPKFVQNKHGVIVNCCAEKKNQLFFRTRLEANSMEGLGHCVYNKIIFMNAICILKIKTDGIKQRL